MPELKRTDLSVQRERAVLVSAQTGRRIRDESDPLAELRLLAKAAGAIVVDSISVRLRKITARTYIGKGIVEQLAARAEENRANLVIFDNDLTPAQIRELEQTVNCKILDRSELILDIFAARARTHEAKLQVELAQLQYTAPRLRGMWTHLERIAGAGGASAAGSVGGIGTRGPGERQIEIDRRIVRARVAALKRELDAIDERKLREVQSRADCFTVSLVGYTNSGKTTLLNKLTGTDEYTADKLFATLDTKTVRWEIGETQAVLLSDTVGFVRDLPHRLVASFRATLEEALHADLLLHVIDASNAESVRQVHAVNEVLSELGCADVPMLALLNKIDVAADESVVRMLESRMPDTLRISAHTGAGLDGIVEAVCKAVSAGTLKVTLLLPAGDGRLIAAVDRESRVLARRYAGETVEMDVVIEQANLNRLTGRHHLLQVRPTNGKSPEVS